MNKKYYTIFIASDQNQYSRSLQVSKTKIMMLLLFVIVVIVLAALGSLRLLNQGMLNYEIQGLKQDYLLLNNIVTDLNYSMDSDSTIKYDQFVSEFYKAHSLDYPDLAPVDGYVTRGLQIENNHLGIDIAAKFQDKVFAPAYGKVLYTGEDDILGKTIIISHLGGFVTVFGHNDTILVSSGQNVNKKEIISYVGETGNSHGPHLHYEIWKNNQILDPREFVLEYKKKDVSISEDRK